MLINAKKTLCILVVVIALKSSLAQNATTIITTPQQLRKSVQQDINKKYVDIRQIIPDIKIDLRYGSTNNFTNSILYNQPVPFLRLPAATALKQVQNELHQHGMGLLIYDAYRPLSVTKKIWTLVKDSRYAANPVTGSGHNRGIAVDLTIIDLKTGKTIDMGTDFDNFSDSSGHQFLQLPQSVLKNRRKLKGVMIKAGFKALDTEWWHYAWNNDRGYELTDIDFRQMGIAIK